MSTAVQQRTGHPDTWQSLMHVIARAVELDGERRLPLVLTSLPDLPEYDLEGPPISFIHGPPGRNIALAVGLRAALPDTPLLLVMNADAVTLGMNHLIHAARRNMGMTLMILRSDVTDAVQKSRVNRTSWRVYGIQESIERKATPLELATSLDAASVSRGSIDDPEELARLVNDALLTPGFSMVGVTSGTQLPLGVLSRTQLPEYFDSYRDWSSSLRELLARKRAAEGSAPPDEAAGFTRPLHTVPRHEVRIAGLGGQGVKLAGSVLNTAAGDYEGLWTTQRGEYGSATRGGPSLVDVISGSERIGYPRADNPDVMVLLSEKSVQQYADSAKPGGYLIVDADKVESVPPGAVSVPIVRISIEQTGKHIAAGIVSLGCIAAVSSIVSVESMKKSIAKNLPAKLVQANVAALTAGYEATRNIMEGDHNE